MISSTGNATIKAIRALRHRKARQEQGRYFVEGIRIVTEAAVAHEYMERCMVAPDLLHSDHALAVVEQLRAAGVPVTEVTSLVFASISVKENPQGLGAVMRQQVQFLSDVDARHGLCWVALNEVRDPGNLGTVIRTAEAVGAGGVILLGDCADPYDPIASRASTGAIFSQPVVCASFEEFLPWATDPRLQIVGTSDAAAIHYREAGYGAPLVLLMGSEREGLSTAQQDACDMVVRIPMMGRSDSLNLAVATGVMLYEILARSVSRL